MKLKHVVQHALVFEIGYGCNGIKFGDRCDNGEVGGKDHNDSEWF